MDIAPSTRSRELAARLNAFMAQHVYPNESRYYLEAERLGPWTVYPLVEELKPLAREAGLWNLFLPAAEHAEGLSNVDYAPLCECRRTICCSAKDAVSRSRRDDWDRGGSTIACAWSV